MKLLTFAHRPLSFLRPALVFAALLIPLYLSGATTRYVATTGSDSNAGTQAAPLATIQRAVDLSQPGDTVVVANGTYGPNGNYTCGDICSQNGYSAPVVFYNSGTASAPITVTAQNKWGAVLDCGLPSGYSGDGTDGVKACDTYFDFQGSASYIVIQNFDITREYWSGANVNGSNNHDIKFIGNHFHHIGNRIYTVPAGTSSYGIVGVYAGTPSSNVTFDRNQFNNIGRLPHSSYLSDDYSHDHGLYVYNGPYTITNNIFYNNTAGWGVQISPGTHDTTIIGNTFSGANPYQDGLVMLWGNNTKITIQNNIFSGARNYAVATYQASESGSMIDHSIVYGSSGGVIGSTSGLTLTNNRVNTDPMFINASGYDFHLQAGSPAIGAGATVNDPVDFAGNARPGTAGYDIGAFEYQGSSAPPPTPPAPPTSLSASVR